MLSKIFFPVLMLLVISNAVDAADDNKKLRIAVPVIHNLAEISDDGRRSGVLLDLLHKVEDTIGQKLELSILPFPRILASIKVGAVDFGIFIENEKRNEIAHLTHRIYETNFVLVSSKTSPINDIHKLKNKTMGISKRGVSEDLLGRVEDAKVLRFSSHKALMSSFLVGKIDAFITPDFRFVEMVEKDLLNYADFNVSLFADPRYLTLYASKKFKEANPILFHTIKDMKRLSLKNFGSEILKEHYHFE